MTTKHSLLENLLLRRSRVLIGLSLIGLSLIDVTLASGRVAASSRSGQSAVYGRPTLGSYPHLTVNVGGNATITPNAAPGNVVSINVSASTGFKGVLSTHPQTGIVRVTNAHPAGVYNVTVTAFDSGRAMTAVSFPLIVQTAAPCAWFSFSNGSGIPVGGFSLGSAVGDFNGDGKQDLAISGAGGVAVRLGDGAGNFSGATWINSSMPSAPAVGDFNGDGKHDLAFADLSQHAVGVRYGDGAGHVSAPGGVSANTYPVGNSPFSLALGDFNGDHHLDFVTANRDSGNLTIRFGDGSGFGAFASQTIPVGADPTSVLVGDFNGDGKPDIAAANSGASSISIRLGDGAGNFPAATEVLLPVNPYSLALGDFNGDGKQDLAASSIAGALFVFPGNGSGQFGAPWIGVGASALNLAVGDFDGDGKLDLATSNFFDNFFAIRNGDGLGHFGVGVQVGVGSAPSFTAVGDFNGDGKQDLAVSNYDESFVSVLLNTCTPPPPASLGNYPDAAVELGGNASFAPGSAPADATSLSASASAGFKGTFIADANSGVIHVINAHPAGEHLVTVRAFNALGASPPKTFKLTVSPAAACGVAFGFSNSSQVNVGAQPGAVTVGDFDNDGVQDLATANQGGGTVSVRLGNGAGGFGGTIEINTGFLPSSLVAGNFNGDGWQDIAVANLGAGTASILLGGGAGTFSDVVETEMGSAPVALALADFNRDGKLDLAAANLNGGTVSIRLGNGDGGFGALTQVGVGSEPSALVADDFNGDGQPDLAVANKGSNTVTIRWGNGAGGFGAATTVAVGQQPRALAAGDLNGDGQPDLAVANSGSASVSIRFGNGAGNFSGTTEIGVGAQPRSVAVNDFNGDNKPDLAVANFGAGTISILPGNGAGGFGGALNYSAGAGALALVTGDFNGDRKQDLAVANNGIGVNTVSVRLNSCAATTCPLISLSPAALPPGTAGNFYSQTLTAVPSGTYRFSLAAGSLPSGFTLDAATGAILGVSRTTGSNHFSVKALGTNGCSGTQAFVLVLGCPAITLSPLPAPELNQTYNQTITALPAGGGYTFAVTSGSLPPNLILNAATGTVSGRAMQPGAYEFTITASSNGGCAGSRVYSFSISNACPTITLPDLPGGTVGQLYSQSLAALPGGSYSYTVSGNPPPGVQFYNGVGLLFGYPTTPGVYDFSINAKDENNCTGGRKYLLTITKANYSF